MKSFCFFMKLCILLERTFMKIVFVVDSITDIKNKINLIQTYFGDNIVYVVKSHFLSIFETFGYKANAVYNKNLSEIIHILLLKSNIEPILLCYSSLNFDANLLTRFRAKIGNGDRIVNIMPDYNSFERICNNAYNIYVKAIFKAKDSLISPKLQYLPVPFVVELLNSHFGNKLFETNPENSSTLYIENSELNNSTKIKTKFNKFALIPIIIALLITMFLLISLAFIKVNYIFVLIFVSLYILDIVFAIIYQCKLYFDARFLN